MKKILLAALGLVMILATLGIAGCDNYFGSGEEEGEVVSYTINSQQDVGISVNGTGKITVAPDVAVLVMGVESQKETVAEAQQEVSAAMEAVMDVLESYNTAAVDIKTQQFSIQPVYQWTENEQLLIGYKVTNTITVDIKVMPTESYTLDYKVGKVIDDAVAAGGDNIRINNIGFTIDEPEAYYEDAREEAMKDAKEKAEQLADLADVNLGKPFYISEGSNSVTPPVVYRDYITAADSSGESQASISSGDLDIQINVYVVYAVN